MYAKVFDLYAKVLDEVRKIMAPTDNRWNFLFVILALALVALAVPVFAVWQIGVEGKVDIPDALLSIAATAIGALASLINRMSKATVPGDTP